MKKTIEKLITTLLIVTLLFNFIGCNTPVYAADPSDVINTIAGLLGGFIAFLLLPVRLAAIATGLAANVLTGTVAYMDGATPNNTASVIITPFDIFFNKTQITDVNFLHLSVGGNTLVIRTAVAKWYYVIRLISIAILLLILLYVGIRMAISTVASEKANYKKALVDWVTSLALVFVLHYIIMFTINANSAIVNALGASLTDEVSGTILEIAGLGAELWGGVETIGATIVYCMIVFQTVVFLIKYIKRMLTVGFLIVISPLISITYSIDKMGDNKAQALNTWLKEFIYNVLIQPFHCIMYLVFVDTAFKLLANPDKLQTLDNPLGKPGITLGAAILAILCIKFVDTGEKIVRKIFGFDQASSLSPLETAAMVHAAKDGGKAAVNAAKSARKGLNKAKQNFNKAADKIATNNRANKYMKEGRKDKDGKVQNFANKSEAKAQAKKDIQTERAESIRKKKASKDARRNEKVEKAMKNELGEEKFKEYKALQEKQAKNPDSLSNAEKEKLNGYNESRKTAESKVAEKENRGKKVRKAVSATGSMALAGDGVLPAYVFGKSIYQGGKEFANSSTGNIAKEAGKFSKGKNATEEVEHGTEVFQKGERGDYESKSSETKDLESKIDELLRALGQGDKKDQVTANISRDLLKDPENFDLNAALTRAVGPEAAKDPELIKAAQAFADHKQDGYLYDQMKKAEAIGLPVDVLMRSIVNGKDYSESASSESSYSEPTNDSVEVKTVSENIDKKEEKIDITEKVDSGDKAALEKLLRDVESKLDEFPPDSDMRTTEQNNLYNKYAGEKIKLQLDIADISE